MRDKLNNAVLFDVATYDKLYKEVCRDFALVLPFSCKIHFDEFFGAVIM